MTNISSGKKRTNNHHKKTAKPTQTIFPSYHKKQHWKGGTLLAPIPPALVSVGTMEDSNILTVAWTGILNTIPPKTYISVRKERFSYPMLIKTNEFVINLPPANLVRAVDYCGVRSGKDHNKWKEMHLTPLPAEKVGTPLIAECPLHLECKITDMVDLGTHTMFVSDIVGMDVAEECINRNGKLEIETCNLLAFAHGEYFTMGKKVGSFGYSVRKKK